MRAEHQRFRALRGWLVRHLVGAGDPKETLVEGAEARTLAPTRRGATAADGAHLFDEAADHREIRTQAGRDR